jgi:hypothetical protein
LSNFLGTHTKSLLMLNPTDPSIDPGTGGKITGMIAAAGKILSLAKEVADAIENAARAVSK